MSSRSHVIEDRARRSGLHVVLGERERQGVWRIRSGEKAERKKSVRTGAPHHGQRGTPHSMRLMEKMCRERERGIFKADEKRYSGDRIVSRLGNGG